MPIISSDYQSFLSNGHIQTILPNILRKIQCNPTKSSEIPTPDNDFLELDWYTQETSHRIVILSHGLEGNSRRAYIRGMASLLHRHGYDVLAWNFRTCGSKINRQKRMYHSGETEDIGTIIRHIDHIKQYTEIFLVGFSMGGNVSLKYLGEQSHEVNPKIKAAAVISVPIDLVGSSIELGKQKNKLYMGRFLRKLKRKLEKKAKQFPEEFSTENYKQITSFEAFDNRYTAPVHGFLNARDYWERASSLPYLEKIRIPTLIINALNDSFLSPSCFPYDIARDSDYIYLETPQTGGHVGFYTPKKVYWSEKRVHHFLSQF